MERRGIETQNNGTMGLFDGNTAVFEDIFSQLYSRLLSPIAAKPPDVGWVLG
jgi:hypothetical protein